MKRRAILSVAAVLILAVIGTLVWLGGEEGQGSHPFRIAIVTWVGYGPFYVARDKGFFDEVGLDVDIIKIEDEGARRSAFVKGDVQGAINTIDALASGVPQGVPGKVIFKIDDSFGGDGLVVRKDINSVSELKGKTVAYPKGLPSHFFLLYLLDKAGMTSKDIISRNMEAGDAGAAFVAGKVDAAVTWEPWLTKAGESDHGKVLVTTRDAPGLIVDIFMVSPKTLEQRREDVTKLVKAWFKAIEFTKSNPQEAHKIMAAGLDIPQGDIAAMAEGIKYADYEENVRYFGIGKNPAESDFAKVFEKAGQIWQREGLIKQPAPADQVMDLSFLKAYAR